MIFIPFIPWLQVTGKGETRSMLAWHPDGTDLAVPGLEGEVVFYERHNWKVSCTLQGTHTAPVSVLAFSNNGSQPACACRLQATMKLDALPATTCK